MKIFITLFFVVVLSNLFSQEIISIRKIDSTFYNNYLDSLKENFSFNKQIPKKYELSILIALSYFPELKTTKIKFKETKIKTSLNARPTIWSLFFREKDKRQYIVRINNSKKDSLVPISEAPFNAKIGVFGHEFAHFVDYNNRNFNGVMERLKAYSKDETKELYEKEIDSITIKRGLGWQIHDWSYYAIFEAKAKKKYVAFKKKIYFEPFEIEKLINKELEN